MATRRFVIGVLVVTVTALVIGCGGGGKRRPDKNNKDSALHRDLDTTKVGDRYVDGKVSVREVDRSQLARGVVTIVIKNRTEDFLTDLAYEVTLYYRNNDPDPSKRAAMPFTPQTAPRKRIDLDAKEKATIVVKPGVLKAGASDVKIRIRAAKPEATPKGATFMSDRVKVMDIKRDWFASPPTVKFTVKNVWEGPLRIQFKVLLIKGDKVVGETGWKNAPAILPPGGQTVLEPDLSGKSVIGTLPALKLKRPRI